MRQATGPKRWPEAGASNRSISREQAMTTAALMGRTDWEAAQYAADHGKSAQQAIDWRTYARWLHDHAAESIELLGLREIPEPRPQMWPVTGGTDEDRVARIDAWAKRHGVKAGTDEASGTYRAVLGFGPVKVIAYMIPDRTMADRLARLYGAVRETGSEGTEAA